MELVVSIRPTLLVDAYFASEHALKRHGAVGDHGIARGDYVERAPLTWHNRIVIDHGAIAFYDRLKTNSK